MRASYVAEGAEHDSRLREILSFTADEAWDLAEPYLHAMGSFLSGRGMARQRLAAVGVEEAAIAGGERCTIAEPEYFFSHRRDRRSGRIATVAWIDLPTL